MLPYWLLLCHLIGDYVLQSHTMAVKKTTDLRWAIIHATFYTLPFAVLVAMLGYANWKGLAALAVISITHASIDRYRLAAYWCRWYGVGFPGVWWRPQFGTFVEPPPFLGVWLLILVDNTMHLAINGAAIAWLVS